MSNPTKAVELDVEPEVEDILRPSELPVPTMNVNLQPQKDENPVVTNGEMIVLYKKILSFVEDDRKDSDEVFRTFLDMAVNDGDASAPTKEAMVQLLKIRTDSTDKMTKIMDLLMRYVLKERDTFPKFLAQSQENHIIFKGGGKRSFLEKLEQSKARKIQEKSSPS